MFNPTNFLRLTPAFQGLLGRAFLWNGSTVSDLGNPGERHDALAISDAGVVVGSAWTGSYTPE